MVTFQEELLMKTGKPTFQQEVRFTAAQRKKLQKLLNAPAPAPAVAKPPNFTALMKRAKARKKQYYKAGAAKKKTPSQIRGAKAYEAAYWEGKADDRAARARSLLKARTYHKPSVDFEALQKRFRARLGPTKLKKNALFSKKLATSLSVQKKCNAVLQAKRKKDLAAANAKKKHLTLLVDNDAVKKRNLIRAKYRAEVAKSKLDNAKINLQCMKNNKLGAKALSIASMGKAAVLSGRSYRGRATGRATAAASAKVAAAKARKAQTAKMYRVASHAAKIAAANNATAAAKRAREKKKILKKTSVVKQAAKVAAKKMLDAETKRAKVAAYRMKRSAAQSRAAQVAIWRRQEKARLKAAFKKRKPAFSYASIAKGERKYAKPYTTSRVKKVKIPKKYLTDMIDMDAARKVGAIPVSYDFKLPSKKKATGYTRMQKPLSDVLKQNLEYQKFRNVQLTRAYNTDSKKVTAKIKKFLKKSKLPLAKKRSMVKGMIINANKKFKKEYGKVYADAADMNRILN